MGSSPLRLVHSVAPAAGDTRKVAPRVPRNLRLERSEVKSVDYRTEEVFRGELLRDDRILWSGQPEANVLLGPADAGLIPFGLLWLASTSFILLTTLGIIGDGPKGGRGAPLIFVVVPGFFVAIGLHMVFGRFVCKYWKKKNTYYAVTNQRVLVLTKLLGTRLQAAFIHDITNIDKSVRRSGIGTPRLGSAGARFSPHANTGMDLFGSGSAQEAPAFYDIREPDRVYDTVAELKRTSANRQAQ